ncbi:MAG: cobyrinate a,c-diamide synthase [Blautia sp.]|nr:cobyrinate a,c-diamide synthase [Blautia sp.]
MKLPRVMLAGVKSGSGKTTITTGLLALLKERGLNVQAFKCGPDYIDPMFHSNVIGVPSVNLDTFFLEPDGVKAVFSRHAVGSDISVIEGVMGYYDGLGGYTTRASSYELATVTDTPVILIVDGRGMSTSAAAIIKGFLDYRPDDHVAGVIFNRISPMLYPRLKMLTEQELSIRCLGYVSENECMRFESRHLGLMMPEEIKDLKGRISRIAGALSETLDVEGILEIAEGAADINSETAENEGAVDSLSQGEMHALFTANKLHVSQEYCGNKIRIALAKDEAFCFIYEDNLNLLRTMGAEIVTFSPLHDAILPDSVQGLLLYGGYPELYAEQLSANKSMRNSILDALKAGLPCMAECGGFMYLHEYMEGEDGCTCPMVGAIAGKAFKTEKLQRFGYKTLRTEGMKIFGAKISCNTNVHEFHYYDSENPGDCISAEKPLSGIHHQCMHVSDTLLAGFPHLYYCGAPEIAEAFMNKCRGYVC